MHALTISHRFTLDICISYTIVLSSTMKQNLNLCERPAKVTSGMSRRNYNQYCALANALDQMGERWTLLIIRQLLSGPKRFKDLLDGLPGIGTNLLAARLKQLEADGILQHGKLPPPAASAVYELTERGRELEPVIHALARWGRPLLGHPLKGDKFQPTYVLVAMRSIFNPKAASGVRETYEYHVEGEVFHAEVEDGTVEISMGAGREPAFVLTSDAQTFLLVGTEQLEMKEALASGRMKLEGSREAFKRSGAIFSG